MGAWLSRYVHPLTFVSKPTVVLGTDAMSVASTTQVDAKPT
jgi:hypothetical protein